MGSLCIVLGAVLSFSLFLNLWVDPLRMHGGVFSSAAFEPYREMSSQIRASKCGLIRTAPAVDVALFGSSRVANAFDPLLEAWGGREVYNLACPAGFIHEGEAMFRYLLRYHDPEMVIFGLDPGDMSSALDTRALGDFASSPLGPAKFRLDREIRFLVGTSTLEQSFETIGRRLSGTLPQYDGRGMRRRPPELPMSQRAFLEQSLRGEFAFGSPDEALRDEPLDAEKAELLGGVIDTCRERGIRLVIFIHPQHALLHASVDGGVGLPYVRERRDLVDWITERQGRGEWQVELWDFGGFHPINCEAIPQDDEARMKYWTDLEHYTVEVGGLMVARMLGVAEDGDYGMRLTPGNFRAWEEQAVEMGGGYVGGAGREDLEWKMRVSGEE